HFFFQAEDGIRDFHVTGVQTCALPISKTVLDKTTLLQSGIPEEKIENTNIISTGLGTNSMESFILELPTLAIGNWKIKKFITAVLDLSAVNYAYQQMNLPPGIRVSGGEILFSYAPR